MKGRKPRDLQQYINDGHQEFSPLFILLCIECAAEADLIILIPANSMTPETVKIVESYGRAANLKWLRKITQFLRVTEIDGDLRAAEDCAAESLTEHFERLGTWPHSKQSGSQ